MPSLGTAHIYVGTVKSGGGASPGYVYKIKTRDASEVWRNSDFLGTIDDIAVDSNGDVYAIATTDEVKKISGETGVTEWTFSVAAGTNQRNVAVSPDGQHIYATADGRLYRLTTAGAQDWQDTTATFESVAVDPLGVAYVRTQTTLYAINSAQTQLWNTGSVMTSGGTAPIIYFAGLAIAGDGNSKGYAWNTADGSDVWANPVTGVGSFTSNFIQDLFVVGGFVYWVDENGDIFRSGIANGQSVRFSSASRSITDAGGDNYESSAGAGGSIYVPVTGTTPALERLDRSDGTVLWSQGTGAYSGNSAAYNVVRIGPGVDVLEERVRSNTSVDAGPVIASTTLAALDHAVSEDFLPGVEYFRGDLVAFRELLSRDEDALLYYPYRRQNNEFLDAFDGETILARLARTFPPSLLDTVDDITELSGDLVDGEKVPATAAVEHLFSVWAAAFPWFRYASVPDLRIPQESGDYTGTAGVAYVFAYFINQDKDSRRTMRQILEEFLAPFPGTVITLDDLNRLKLIPRFGPDADQAGSPAVTLTTKDAYSVVEGQEATPRVNRVTVTVQPYTETVDGEPTIDAWFHVANDNFSAADYLTVPGGVDLTGDPQFGKTTGKHPQSTPNFWPMRDDVFSEDIDFESSVPTLVADADIKYTEYDSDSGYTTENQATESNLTFTNLGPVLCDSSAGWQSAFRITRNFSGLFWGSDKFEWEFEMQYSDGGGGGQRGFLFRIVTLKDTSRAGAFGKIQKADLGVTLESRATTFGPTNTKKSATFGTTFLDGGSDNLPSANGGNLLVESQGIYGIIEKTINIENYDLGSDQILQIARGIVLDGIEPKTLKEVEQSVWNAFPVRNRHVGRLVELPDADEGIVVNRTYTDDMGVDYGEGGVSSFIQVEVTTAALDAGTNLLLLDNGEFMLLDNGEIAEKN